MLVIINIVNGIVTTWIFFYISLSLNQYCDQLLVSFYYIDYKSHITIYFVVLTFKIIMEIIREIDFTDLAFDDSILDNELDLHPGPKFDDVFPDTNNALVNVCLHHYMDHKILLNCF